MVKTLRALPQLLINGLSNKIGGELCSPYFDVLKNGLDHRKNLNQI